jgi:hypothetical protein
MTEPIHSSSTQRQWGNGEKAEGLILLDIVKRTVRYGALRGTERWLSN